MIPAGLILWENEFPSITAGQNITIDGNKAVLVTQTISEKLGFVHIMEGSQLIFGEDDLSGIAMDADGFIVEGSLIAGSESCRYLSDLTITLHGDRPNDPSKTPAAYKGIVVEGNTSKIELHGKRYFPTWTR